LEQTGSQITLHVVAFNVPWPADYGGVIDIYHRLSALHSAGVNIILHCFTYGRPEAPALQDCCERVYYYRRNMSPLLHLRTVPFIAASRDCESLFRRLQQDGYPILIEGLHGCELLRRLRRQERAGQGRRCVVVRAHNVEQQYYRSLAHSERRLLRKIYLTVESYKLRRYEPVLLHADAVLAVTAEDALWFRRMGCSNVQTVAPFHPQPVTLPDTVHPDTGGDPYVLYHADLSVPDNEWAVQWLLHHIAPKLSFRLVIAGRYPRSSLRRQIARHANVMLVESPSESAMTALLRQARCTVLVTRQRTGFKLKLINTLYCGQHCLVNSDMVYGTGLASFCHVADSPVQMLRLIQRLMQTPFSDADRHLRRQRLAQHHDNAENARQVINLINRVYCQ